LYVIGLYHTNRSSKNKKLFLKTNKETRDHNVSNAYWLCASDGKSRNINIENR